jgi:hypothetical protein
MISPMADSERPSGSINRLWSPPCIGHDLSLLTTDRDFKAMSRYCSFVVLDVGET